MIIRKLLLGLESSITKKSYLSGLVTEGDKGSSLNFNLLASPVKELDHEVEKIRFPQIRRRLFCELCTSDGASKTENIGVKRYFSWLLLKIYIYGGRGKIFCRREKIAKC